jgi:uncharacterized protein (DUF849 family)
MTQGYHLTVAPNGARRGKADHPALPLSTAGIAETARACQAEGAQAIHLHVRDGDGRHSLDAGRYRAAMAAIAERAPGMAIQITTEAADRYDVAAQYACLDALRPAAASISVREMARDSALAARCYALAREAGTEVQHILYTPDCIARLKAWCNQGVITDPVPSVILVLGRYVPPVAATPGDLSPLLAALDRPVRWAACAFGRNERACLLAALRLGGQVRIGFENNTETPEGAPLADNAASVRAFVAAAAAEGLHPARPSIPA